MCRVHSAATTPAPCTLPAPKSKPSQDKAGRQSWARQDKGKARKERGRKSPFSSKSPPSDSPFDHPRGKTSRRQLNRAGLSIDRRPSIRSGIDNNKVTAHTAATVPSLAHIAAIDKQCASKPALTVLSPTSTAQNGHSHDGLFQVDSTPPIRAPRNVHFSPQTASKRQERRPNHNDHTFLPLASRRPRYKPFTWTIAIPPPPVALLPRRQTRARTQQSIGPPPLHSPAHTGDGSTPETEGRILGSLMGP